MKSRFNRIYKSAMRCLRIAKNIFLFLLLPSCAYAQTIVAPNLMVIFANGYSMNYFLDNPTKKDVPGDTIDTKKHDHFNDLGDIDYYGTIYPKWGTMWSEKYYGEYKKSKMYIAKQALGTVLSTSVSDKINFGFATFRQTFGMEAASVTLTQRNAYLVPVPKDRTIYDKTTAEKQAYGYDANNFSYIDWPYIRIGYGGRAAQLGQGGLDYNKQVIDDASASYTTGGLISVFKYNPTASDQSYSHSLYGSSSVWNDLGATGNINPPSPTNPTVTWKLCRTEFLSSSSNNFQALYLADKDMPFTYKNMYSVMFIAWGSSFGTDGYIGGNAFTTCPAQNNAVLEAGQRRLRIANTYRYKGDPAPRVYFSGIANYEYTSGTGMRGVLTGWSGETTYTETDSVNRTGTMTAKYPSGSASPYRTNADGLKNDRAWLVTSTTTKNATQQTNANHMGVFLDLPQPNLGYQDQRGLIKDFMRIEQMNDSGLEYNPSNQSIANAKGIAASTYAWASDQSPIYDSLHGALAYYKAYKAVDTFDSCRSNNVLLLFDGKEDAHWILVNGQRVFVKPSVMAAKLLEIGVKTYVVYLSSTTGDIADANAIALAGGTTKAYAATDATTLLSALGSVFSGLSGEVFTASPALPKTLSDTGSYAYIASQESNPTAGHMSAYQVNAKGVVASAASWDAAALMTNPKRQNALLSNKADGTMLAFNSLDDAAFSASGSPDVATIKAFTLDPSYNSGAYLAGRKSGSFLGAFSDQSIAPFMLLPTSNSPSYLTDANYATFLQNNKSRTKQVLFQNDDGFLYSVNASSGDLLWGWLPRPLAASLKNYTTFWSSGAMRGGSVIVDAPVGSGYASYVLGTAKSGEIHYALRLDSTGTPAKVSWINQVSGMTSPTAQSPVATYLSSAPYYKTYANYLGVSGTSTTLYTQEVGDGTTVTSGALGLSQPATSELAVNQGTGVAKLYLGDKGGGVWLLDASTSAATAASSLTKAGTHYNNQPVRYVGAYTWSGKDYVWSTSDSGITVYVKDTTSSTWKNLWESHAGGAGKWDVETYTADSTGANASATGIQSIPSGYKISASPIVEKGALIVPITQASTTAAASCSAGEGYYYFFRLADGFFPKGIFSLVKSDGTTTPLVDNLYIGKGKPKKPTPAFGSGGKFIFGISEQTGSSGGKMPAVKVEGSTGGIVSWREVISR